MYESIIALKDSAEALADKYFRKHDEYMTTFWNNCAHEYERRAKELSVGDAE